MIFIAIGAAILLPLFGITMTEAPLVWPLSAVIYNAGLVYGFANLPKFRIKLIIFILVALALLVVETAFFISYYLQNAGFNKTFFYHLHPDLIHAGIGEHALLLLFFPGLVILYFTISVRYLLKARPYQPKYVYGCLGLFLLGLVISPSASSLASYFRNNSPGQATAFHEDFPELSGRPVRVFFQGDDRYNVVLIYLESIEQRYFDEAVFPGLLPELKLIGDESVIFTNVAQADDAGFTMGGMVASQCGYPLASRHNITNFGIYDDFLPHAVCLGDLLQADGYHLVYMGGADARFAGKENFLQAHGYSEVIDKQVIISHLGNSIPYNDWGIYDDTLLELAFRKYHALGSQPDPFLLTLLTLDTHHPRGHLSPSCGGYEELDNPMLDAVHCSGTLISRFIRRVRSSPFSDNTVIVLFSDHLAMRNTASALLAESEEPANLTFWVNFPDGRSGENSNPGIHYDVGPTILDLMDYELRGQMGFGSSLARGPGYLIKKLGEKGWREHEAALKEIAARLWETNDVSLQGKDISFNVNEVSLVIGDRNFSLRSEGFSEVPESSVFIFDSTTLMLKDIHSFPFDRGMDNATLSRILLQNKDDLAFAISYPMNLPGFCDYSQIHPLEYCFFFGKPGGSDYFWAPIRGDFTITAGYIDSLANAKPDTWITEQREEFLRELTSPRVYEGISPPIYIAHAGGGIDDQTYTNSLEALNLNYDLGHRFFEIDFSWTQDGKLVAIHDWEESLERRFGAQENSGIPTKDEFKRLVPKNGLTQLTLNEVLEWAREKEDAYIVTDVKDRNIPALRKILREYGQLAQYVIPQVYNYGEYHEAEAMGYEDIILTLYRMRLDFHQLVDFVALKTPFAVTMHWPLAQGGLAQMLKPWKIFAYAHTVNDPELVTDLRGVGVDGFYTDFIVPLAD